jgi:hypothetical protein
MLLKDSLQTALNKLAQFAKIGPRGGIVKSPKAPDYRERNGKRGSKVNKPGAASGQRGKIKVPASVEKALQTKADEFNKRYKDKLGYGVTIGQLRSVYQRGVGAFQSGSSSRVKSAEQWSMARINAFLYLVKNGRPENPRYTQDNDLLPKKHPKAT